MLAPPRHSSGYTLIEVAVVILILGLLFGFSIPTFRSYRQSQMLEAATQKLFALATDLTEVFVVSVLEREQIGSGQERNGELR